MMLQRILWLAVFLGVLAACNCSHKTTTPITPSDTGIDSSLPVLQFSDEETTHSLLGMWNVNFNLDELTAKITSDKRDAAQHFNVTSFIAPEIEINSWNPFTEVIDVDVTITNTYTVDAYDVRLIIYTDTVGHRLLNDNGWTPLYDIPAGLPINPFTTYAKSVPGRLFEGETDQTENLRVLLPGGNPNITFAIDASYPDNCKEPHKIGALSQGALYDEAGSSAILRVGVYDHQNNADSVGLYLPEITGTSIPVPFTYIGYNGWELELFNNTGASMGQYDGFLVASSSDSGTLALYDDVKITISLLDGGWARTWGGESTIQWHERGWDIASDGSGNIYVAGEYENAVDFNPGPGEDYHSSNGGGDAYLSKFDKHGNFVWARTWGAAGLDEGYATDIDDLGNIYVTGIFRNTVDFDPGPGIVEYSSNGLSDVFLSKFDSNGNFVWARTWGGVNSDIGRDVTIDGSGNVFITGPFKYEVDFDPGPGEDWHIAYGYRDVFLSKFNSIGDFKWACTWGSSVSNADWAWGVTTNYSGNVYVTGSFYGTVDFDPSAEGVDQHTSNGESDIFLSQFENDSDFIRALTWGGSGKDAARSVATNDSENVWITGSFSETVDFDPGPGVDEHTSNGMTQIFLSKFDINGDYIWARTWGGVQLDRGNDIDTDNSGNIYVTGQFLYTVDFDPGPKVDEHTSYGTDDIFLSKFRSNGEHIWARTWGGLGADLGWGVTTDDTGNICVTGEYLQTVDFDPGPEEDKHTAYPPGNPFGPDSFLLKVLPNGYWE